MEGVTEDVMKGALAAAVLISAVVGVAAAVLLERVKQSEDHVATQATEREENRLSAERALAQSRVDEIAASGKRAEHEGLAALNVAAAEERKLAVREKELLLEEKKLVAAERRAALAAKKEVGE